MHLVGNLKRTYRFNSIPSIKGDSSADHSWRLALATFIIAEELKLNIDLVRAIKIALVHDLAESVAGDIDVRDIKSGKYTEEQKLEGELEAMKKICSTLPENLGQEINDLWSDYNSAGTKEAKYIKALDKAEGLIETWELGHDLYNDPEIIGIYGNKQVKDFPELKEFMRVIKDKLREEFVKGGLKWREEYDV